jgi:UDP-N-acetylglucosamine 1-carboxyvinyltransferase
MSNSSLVIEQSGPLCGEVVVNGAKNASLAIMASLVLAQGVSCIKDVPASADVLNMIQLLQDFGTTITYDHHTHVLTVDTRSISKASIRPDIMGKMRASMVVAGPLLARFGYAEIALPGGCVIGARPIDLHLKGFQDMGVVLEREGSIIKASLPDHARAALHRRIILQYPSVGATENIMMLAAMCEGRTTIINAAHEPEVFDVIAVLNKMGARVWTEAANTIHIEGKATLSGVEHAIIPDRLEAGALLIAAAITGGEVFLPNAIAHDMDVFLEKLREMGHEVTMYEKSGIRLKATPQPQAVSFKTAPYPGFPTDLQAPLLAAQCVANGTSVVEETVFENRLVHAKELQKMGAQIEVNGSSAIIRGVDKLYGTDVIATDIRASCALVLAGLVAQGQTRMSGIHHWRRGYEKFEEKLNKLGARICLC